MTRLIKLLEIKITKYGMDNLLQDQQLHNWSNLVKASLNIAQVAQQQLSQGNFLNAKVIVDSLKKNYKELPSNLPPDIQQKVVQLSTIINTLKSQCKRLHDSPRKSNQIVSEIYSFKILRIENIVNSLKRSSYEDRYDIYHSGTNYDQDARFANKTQNMLSKSQWPDKYDIKIDLNKVDYELIKIWIQKRITKLLGEQDDIASGTIISHLDESLQKQEKLNAKVLHVAISGILQDKTLTFMSQFWDLLDEAQKSGRGIPQCLIEQKKNNEEQYRKKLSELQDKRHKMNVNRFNQTVKNREQDRDRYDRRDRQYRRSRSPQFKKKKHRDHDRSRRSRSKSHQKRRRSRSYERHQRKKRDRSYEREKQYRRQKHRHRVSEESSSEHNRKVYKIKQRNSSRDSDSSGVVSSSEQSN